MSDLIERLLNLEGQFNDRIIVNSHRRARLRRLRRLYQLHILFQQFRSLQAPQIVAESVRVPSYRSVPRTRIDRGLIKDSMFYKFITDEDDRYKNAARGTSLWRDHRHNFRMDWNDLDELTNVALQEQWFSEYDNPHLDRRLRRKFPLKLLIMCCLAVLAGHSFCLVKQAANMGETTLRTFFRRFIHMGSTAMANHWIRMPDSIGKLQDAEVPYRLAGLPGVTMSVDGVRVRLWSCPHNVRHQYIGKEGYPAITFLVAVSHDGRITYCSRAYQGNMPDTEISRHEETPGGLFSYFMDDPVFNNYQWSFTKGNGTISSKTGARILADGGFPLYHFLTAPSSAAPTIEHKRLNRAKEMVRKDIECTFGDTKQVFPCAKKGVSLEELSACEKTIRTCFALRNFLWERDPRVMRVMNFDSSDPFVMRLRETADFTPEPAPRNARRPFEGHSEIEAEMVEHFDFLYQRKLVRWPRMVVRSRVIEYGDVVDESNIEEADYNSLPDDLFANL